MAVFCHKSFFQSMTHLEIIQFHGQAPRVRCVLCGDSEWMPLVSVADDARQMRRLKLFFLRMRRKHGNCEGRRRRIAGKGASAARNWMRLTHSGRQNARRYRRARHWMRVADDSLWAATPF